MRKVSLVLVFVSFLSCKKDETKSVSDDLQIEVNQKDTLETKKENPGNKILSTDWQDDLIVDYIKNSEKDLIKIHFKNNDKLQWILDSTEKNDSTQFYIYNIGVDVTDEDGSSLRFSSCGWVYLDSVKRKLYEYDLPNEKLIEWKK
jgi:hypothetical protein